MVELRSSMFGVRDSSRGCFDTGIAMFGFVQGVQFLTWVSNFS